MRRDSSSDPIEGTEIVAVANAQTGKINSRDAALERPRYSMRTARTGHGALRNTFSATLLSTSRANPRRP